eukprot:1605739-Rhodomonas_salina.2
MAGRCCAHHASSACARSGSGAISSHAKGDGGPPIALLMWLVSKQTPWIHGENHDSFPRNFASCRGETSPACARVCAVSANEVAFSAERTNRPLPVRLPPHASMWRDTCSRPRVHRRVPRRVGAPVGG